MVTLYHSGISTCSKQVRMCLREKGVPYESRYIELWTYENLHPDYLKLNPNGVVPTLVHDGVPVINALAINEYIDEAFDGPPLKPTDPMGRARMRFWTWTADDVHLAIMAATYTAFLTGAAKSLTPDQIETLIQQIPVPDRRDRWRKFTGGGFSTAELDAAQDKIRWGIDRLEEALSETTWIAGDEFSLADISNMAIIHRIGELDKAMLDPATYPRIDAWWKKISARPSALAVYTTESDEIPDRPKSKSIDGFTGAWRYAEAGAGA